MAGKTPVGMLLRVSTTAQVTAAQQREADIPAQRASCTEFIALHPEWELVKEYVEIGVSGHKVALQGRDKLLEAQEDIRTGAVKVLVVFMFDRLGRIEAETQFVVQSFVRMGAEVWSVKEGQRRFESHADSLLNYITFWQADGESRKTSARVLAAMEHMARQGMYTGGRPPYGYMLVETGRLTKKQLPEKTLAIDEAEAATVRRIFDLAHGRGYGCHRIAHALNEAGLRTRSGGQWAHSAVAQHLRNPVYKGLRPYGRTTGRGTEQRQARRPRESWILPDLPNPELIIVPPARWDAVNSARPDNRRPDSAPGRTALLLAGCAYCGICGAKMTTGYSPYRWTTADGTTHRRDNPVYRCSARASGKVGCTARSSYRKKWVEDAVLAELCGYFDRLPTSGLAENISAMRRSAAEADGRKLEALRRAHKKAQRELNALEVELLRVLSGDSPLPRDTLTELLERKKLELAKHSANLTATQSRRERNAANPPPVPPAPKWGDVFSAADADEQKMLLIKLVERVDISPDCIQVYLRLSSSEFFQNKSPAVTTTTDCSFT